MTTDDTTQPDALSNAEVRVYLLGLHQSICDAVGAGLGVSTRGTPPPVGGINDMNFWSDKATQYLSGVVR